MKFRHHTGVRLALTSGLVTLVGPDWRPLREEFHREALAKGCECDQSTIRTQELKPPAGGSTEAVTPLDERTKIRAALIRMVERNGEDDFTASGTPNLNTLSKEAGFRVDRTVGLEVWHELEREAQAAADAADAHQTDGGAGSDGDSGQGEGEGA